MAIEDQPSSPPRVTLETGPYVLRRLLNNVPLSADGDGDGDGIKINCVEFLGMFWGPQPLTSAQRRLFSADPIQTRTSTLGPRPQKSFILYKYPQTLKAHQENQRIYWLRGSRLPIIILPHPRAPESSRYYSSQKQIKLVYYATGQSPFTLSRSSALCMEPPRFVLATG